MKKNDPEDLNISRGQFLKMSAGFAAVTVLPRYLPYRKARKALDPTKTNSVVQDLGGDTWSLHEVGSADSIKAGVPGDTYNDLLSAGRIPDPYFRENNALVQWVASKDWVYERTFGVSEEIMNKDNVQLICHGLDTLATIWINDQKVVDTDNMFRTYVLDVKKYLKKDANSIRIQFNTLDPYIRQHESAYNAHYGIDLKGDRSWKSTGRSFHRIC